MQHRTSRKWMVVALPLAALPLVSCQQAESSEQQTPPAQVERVAGSEVSRVTLTERAAERLDVQTQAVQGVARSGSATTVVPYGAVLYDAQGATWVYTSPERLVFVRHPVVIEAIQGETAYLSAGPEVGTLVVSVGAAELYGTELDVGH